MIERIKKELKEVHPKLRLRSPVSYWFIGLMGLFNLFIGTGFFLATTNLVDDPILGMVAKVVPFWMWGLFFFSLGTAKLVSIIRDDWIWARRTLLIGVGLKVGWSVALILRTLMHPDNVFLTASWTTLAITQMIIYIYFLPPQEMREFSGRKMDTWKD